MAMTVLWTAMIAVSLLCGGATGSLGAVSAAAAEGAQAAVELCLSMAGMLCLWMGVMEVMRRCGMLEELQRLLRPVLGRIFPEVREDRETMALISANVSANLLGLGNAATPLGIQAAQRMARSSPGVASDSLCLFVVCNTASIQLIPTTIAAVRSAAGCETPFDILPCVWLTSLAALWAGIGAAKLCRWMGRRKL
ncbi:MAG: spore maturation protein A [Clostridiales bacterium]|nr:spore maturation protein A [Clostridiales bacterium]